jgi:hypothetical protein
MQFFRMKRSRLSSVSSKRRIQLAAYTTLRKEWLTAKPMCEVCKGKKATDIHHKNGRFGARLIDTTYFLAVCRTCHETIHKHPAAARENGWLI